MSKKMSMLDIDQELLEAFSVFDKDGKFDNHFYHPQFNKQCNLKNLKWLILRYVSIFNCKYKCT